VLPDGLAVQRRRVVCLRRLIGLLNNNYFSSSCMEETDSVEWWIIRPLSNSKVTQYSFHPTKLPVSDMDSPPAEAKNTVTILPSAGHGAGTTADSLQASMAPQTTASVTSVLSFIRLSI
jgi:hypothetical protein